MSNKQPTRVTVTQTTRISPNMQRIFIQADEPSRFSNLSAGAYIKLLFDHSGFPVTQESQLSDYAMRTYTLNLYETSTSELSIDMVLHSTKGVSGPGAAWAASVKVGDTIYVAGPGASKTLATPYDWVLLAGDMTALPSIRNHLAKLPNITKGYAVIQIENHEDQTPMIKPDNVEVIWVVGSSLSDALRKVTWYEGLVSTWVACEFSTMRKIRQWLSVEKNVPHANTYISSYWKKGRSEDQHRIDKRLDAEAFNME